MGRYCIKSMEYKNVTYGVGLSWEIGIRKWKFNFGKKLFGTSSGYSNYIMLHIGKNAKSLYDSVKNRV